MPSLALRYLPKQEQRKFRYSNLTFSSFSQGRGFLESLLNLYSLAVLGIYRNTTLFFNGQYVSTSGVVLNSIYSLHLPGVFLTGLALNPTAPCGTRYTTPSRFLKGLISCFLQFHVEFYLFGGKTA